MIGTERLFPDRQRALVERLGIGIATLGVVKPRQIVQRHGDIGMIGTKRLFLIASAALVERLGIGIATLVSYSSARLFSDCATSG